MMSRIAAVRDLPISLARHGRCAMLALALAAPGLSPAAAQERGPMLWDLFSLDRIAAQLVQIGLMAVRTQVDLVYDGISANPMTGMVTLTGLKAWPPTEWQIGGDGCEVRIDRLVVQGAPFDEIDVMRLKLQATGATATLDCLPPEGRALPAAVGMSELRLSRTTLDIDYRIASSAATLRLHSQAEGLAAVSLDADVDYLWFTGRYDMQNPDLVVFLKSARLSVENLGGWERVRGLLPPQVADPALAGAVINSFLSEGLPASFGRPPSAERKHLATSATDAWTRFLANPDRLVLETGFDPAEPKFLDFLLWDQGPDAVLDNLKPRAALVPAPARALLPAALLAQALEAPEQLTPDQRLAVGTAFATGVGAPRDIILADELLGPAIEAGSGEAALVLARALEAREPEGAYALALAASASRTPGAAGLLDRVEAALPLARVLEAQAALIGDAEFPGGTPVRLAEVRDEAAMRLTGSGRTRSYAGAALWALIGAAAGDGESAAILAEIDERMRRGGAEAQAVWRLQEADAVERARAAWIGGDLPSSFGEAN